MPTRPTLEGVLLGGRYRVGRWIGAGGMGAVYEGVQEDLGRKVAIKVLLGSTEGASIDAESLRRFSREARAAAALAHPNIVAVTDFSADGEGPPFLVMELLSGRSLARIIEGEGRLPFVRVASLVTQVLDALEAAHRAGLVHRDIKPDNVFVVPLPSGGELVKVLDFGIAKLAPRADAAHAATALTAEGTVLGTPAYMSPEQARGRDVDARTDLYAVGALMFHALTGRLPFSAPSFNALLFAIAEEEPPKLSILRGDLDPKVEALVARAMAKNPDERPASASEMQQALAALARPTSRPPTSDASSSLPYAATIASDRPGPMPSSPATSATLGQAAAVAMSTTAPHALGATLGSSGAGGAAAPSVVTSDGGARASRALPWIVAGGAAVVALVLGGVLVGVSLAKRNEPTAPRQASAQSAANSVSSLPASSPADSAAAPAIAPIVASGQAPIAPSLASSPSVGFAPPMRPSAPANGASTTSMPPSASASSVAAAGRKKTGGTKPYLASMSLNGLYELDYVRGLVNAQMGPVTACFVAAEYDPVEHQFPYYSITVDDAGAVLSVKPPGTDDRDLALDACMAKVFRSIAWGAPKSVEERHFEVGFTARIP